MAAIELERTRRVSEAPPRHSIVASMIQREMGRREVLAVDKSITAASSSATSSLGNAAFVGVGAAIEAGSDGVSEQTAALSGLETRAERLRKQLTELEEAIRSQTAVKMSADERVAFEFRIRQVHIRTCDGVDDSCGMRCGVLQVGRNAPSTMFDTLSCPHCLTVY